METPRWAAEGDTKPPEECLAGNHTHLLAQEHPSQVENVGTQIEPEPVELEPAGPEAARTTIDHTTAD